MRKVLLLLVIVSVLFAGTTVYAADSNPPAGLLRGQLPSPPASPQFAFTDGNWSSYGFLGTESIVWNFVRPVDLTGFIWYADSPDAQLYMIDANGAVLAAVGAATTIPSAPFAIDVSRVKSVRITSANPGQSIRVYELDVYGSVSPIVPAAPSGLTAVGQDRAVQLDWNGDMYASYYRVKRASNYYGPYSVVQTVYGTHYRDATVVNGTPYYYVVSALNEFGESANSSITYAVPFQQVPTAPAHVTAAAEDGQVALQWESVTGAVYYNIKRATAPDQTYVTVGSSVYGYFKDTQVVNGTTYSYVVTAKNEAGESAPSAAVTVTPTAPLPDRVLLFIILTGGTMKEYDLSVAEAAGFVDWYISRSIGEGAAVYPLTRYDNLGPFAGRIDYIAFPSIVSFETNAYKAK